MSTPPRVRIASYNTALNRPAAGALCRDLATGDPQAAAVAAIVAAVAPDILLLNEVDDDPDGAALAQFIDGYLAPAGADYPYRFRAPVNTGVPSGYDLDRDGRCDGPGDALGFGEFPGQYGMALLARYPILTGQVRSFRRFPWCRLPGARLPRDDQGGHWYPPHARAWLPLSSKSHWDVPVALGDRILHCLASHPTPPAFDGPERRNRLRNADELRFWLGYLDDAAWVEDDRGRSGGLARGAHVVLLGDLNADPADGDGERAVIRSLLGHPRLQDPQPRSRGGAVASRSARRRPAGDPALHTGWFGAFGLRLDYVLPDRRWTMLDAGVHWPAPDEPGRALVGDGRGVVSSDHRLVWVDVAVP
ncbi:endonuclease/exonuclease/phosphatase family protein [Spiribacter halobius]|uniref:Endonuclease n=1 Tax=Sediminicurvatus halobius TaxID=2182432 RepID=A0A2U2MWK9_9GAMM|nr:endonuclease/exonuclease/phosphatase family protein [Spiribacter halobius]PWG61249.1 endonuclease [Spiribacter halobius]UEX78439.1 endonuclease/exonuclease/phosphatase family protein [Spiribacter halobius]